MCFKKMFPHGCLFVTDNVSRMSDFCEKVVVHIFSMEQIRVGEEKVREGGCFFTRLL